MRRLLLLAIVLSPISAWATWSAPTQAVFNNSCAASSSCAVTVSAIGAGHLLVVLAHIGNTQTLSSVTAAGETFTVIPVGGGNGSNCPFNGGGNSTQVGCAYVLKSVGGATTVTCNWSGTASASNTSCGFYEVSFTASRVFLETNSINGSNGSAATFSGVNFGNSYLNYINGTNDIIFQMTNVSTGTISAIGSSYVLDNHTGQVADAHLLNTFSNAPPTWTNSGSATSIISGLCFGEDYNANTAATAPTTTPNSGLRLSWSGSGNTRLVTVISPSLFELVFDEGDAWGITGWYDLVNDPGATTNLLSPACPSGATCNASDQQTSEPGLFQRTYYDFSPADTKEYTRSAHFYFPTSPRQLSVLEYNASRIVIETKSEPTVTASGVLNNLIGTARYYIYPNGRIYVHFVATVTNAATFNATHLFSVITLEDPTQTGTLPPDSQGWIRASTTQNPYTGVGPAETYLFAYWGPSTPAPYTNYTKASILIVHSPANTHDGTQVLHSWASGTGFGVVRWGWENTDTFLVGAGGTEVEDWLIQLGTQGSTVLPNITSSTIADPIATAYIASPAAPAPSNEIQAAANQGSAIQFTATDAGTWSCAGCAGSVTSGGLYTAPASVTAQQSYGGYQLLPNNHILNSRVDSLPVDTTHGSTFTISGSPTGAVRTGCPGACVVTITAATAPIWFVGETAVVAGVTDNTYNGTFTIATLPGGCSNLCFTYSQGGQSNSASGAGTVFISWIAGTGLSNLTYLAEYPGNFVNAATPIGGMTFTFTSGNNGPYQFPQFPDGQQENGWYANAAQVSDRHIFSVDTSSGVFQEIYNAAGLPGNASSGVQYLNSSYSLLTNGGTGASFIAAEPTLLHIKEITQAVASSGTINHAVKMTLNQGYCASSFVWPASAFASDGGTTPFGVRFRLKASFDISSFSATAKVLLTQLKQYGMILEDGGTGWNVAADWSNVPSSFYSAFSEIAAANIVGSTNFEAVDESSLMVSSSSGLANVNRETVTFTRTSDSSTTTLDVALQGPAVDIPADPINIQAGLGPQQLTAFNSFGGVIWSMSPLVGTLTSTGLYTPPQSVATPTTTTITVTSVVSPSVSASFSLNVFPSGPLYLVPDRTANYTDSLGNTWWKTNVSESYQTGTDCSQSGSFAAVTDITLWNCFHGRDVTSDLRFVFLVPNGTYQVTYRYGTIHAIGETQNIYSVQNSLVYPTVSLANYVNNAVGGDTSTTAGGQYKRFTQTNQNATVTDNKLKVVVHPVNGVGAFLSSLSIIPGTTSAARGRMP